MPESARVKIATAVQGSGPALDFNALVDPVNIPAYDSNDLDKFDSLGGVLIDKTTGYSIEDYTQVDIQVDNSIAETAAQSSNPYIPYVYGVSTYPGLNLAKGSPRTYLIPGVHPNSVANFTVAAEILREDITTPAVKGKEKIDTDHLAWGREWVYVEFKDANGQPEKRAVKMTNPRAMWGGMQDEENGLETMGLKADPANSNFSIPVYGYYDYKDAHTLDNDPTMWDEQEERDSSNQLTGNKIPKIGYPKPLGGSGGYSNQYSRRFARDTDGTGALDSQQIRSTSATLSEPSFQTLSQSLDSSV